MTTQDTEEQKWTHKHFRRVRWTKRLLRFLPRKSNIHRYPGLKWAGAMARKRMYLWSFRYREVAPALYVGAILSFMPVFGIQIPLAFLLALALRANLPFFVGLQFITNWFTVVPIYYICYQIGRFALKMFNVHVDAFSVEELRMFLDTFSSTNWGSNGRFLLRVVGITSLGGLIIGSFFGTIFDQVYKLMAWRATVVWKRMQEIRIRKLAQKERAAASEDKKP